MTTCDWQTHGNRYFKCRICGELKLRPIKRNCPKLCAVVEPLREAEMTPCDVLLIMPNGADPSWLEIRGRHVCEMLERHGISAGLTVAANGGDPEVDRVIEQRLPRLVINRGFSLHTQSIRRLATNHPGRMFVTVNHSSQTFLQVSRGCSKLQPEFIDLARCLPACFYAIVDERNPVGAANPDAKVIWLPNSVRFPGIEPAAPHDPATIGLFGRFDVLKNWPNQLCALGMVARQRPLKILAGFRGDNPAAVSQFAASYGVTVEHIGWKPWPEFVECLAERVDLVMQASFTESFNYVAMEAMLCRKPAIGSTAIRYLPPECQARADDPADIAAKITEALDSGEKARIRAYEFAADFARRNNAAFLATVTDLLERTAYNASHAA